MEGLAVSVLSTANSILSSVLPDALSGSRGVAAQYTPLTADPAQYFVRRDNGSPATVINVFSGTGIHKYVFERQSRFSTLWNMYEVAGRRHVAAVRAGIRDQSVDFLAKPGLQHREFKSGNGVAGFANKSFFLNDGAAYHWTRYSQYLERVVNLGGAHEEVHQRFARVKLLRRFKLDWELLVHKEFDHEVAIATVIIPMLTQWSYTKLQSAPGARTILPAPGQDQNLSQNLNQPELVSAVVPAVPAETGPVHAAGSSASLSVEARPSPVSHAIAGSLAGVGPITADARPPQVSESELVGGLAPELLVYTKPSTVRNFFNPPAFLGRN